MQGKFYDLRMQDAYNIIKCLQDLACATPATASVFVNCGGLSNLASVLSWPAEGMRHARWAASVVMSDVGPYSLKDLSALTVLPPTQDTCPRRRTIRLR